MRRSSLLDPTRICGRIISNVSIGSWLVVDFDLSQLPQTIHVRRFLTGGGSMRRTGARALPRQRASIDPSCRVANWDGHSVFSRAVLSKHCRPLNKAEIEPRVLAKDIVLWCSVPRFCFRPKSMTLPRAKKSPTWARPSGALAQFSRYALSVSAPAA